MFIPYDINEGMSHFIIHSILPLVSPDRYVKHKALPLKSLLYLVETTLKVTNKVKFLSKDVIILTDAFHVSFENKSIAHMI